MNPLHTQQPQLQTTIPEHTFFSCCHALLLFCIFLASPALSAWHRASVWPHHHPLYSKIVLLSLHSRADSCLLWGLTAEQCGWKVAQRRQCRPSVCVCVSVCECVFFFSLDESRCLLEWMWLVSGREHGGDQFDMKQPVTSLPPSPSSSFTFSGATRQGEAGMQEGETTTENVLLPAAIWQGWITNWTHTNVCTHTHIPL